MTTITTQNETKTAKISLAKVEKYFPQIIPQFIYEIAQQNLNHYIKHLTGVSIELYSQAKQISPLGMSQRAQSFVSTIALRSPKPSVIKWPCSLTVATYK